MTPWYPLSVPTIGEEEIEAVTAVLRSGQTTMGAKVEEFEEAFARYVGARYAVMVNSGSSADLLMAMATPVSGTVLIPAVTWPTHVWSWLLAGHPVRFVDVEELNTTPNLIEAAVRGVADHVSLVHLMGLPADAITIWENGREVTEDCCEALGADVGRVGSMATWSFFFSHQMTTMEGGAVTTNDPDLASDLRSMRSHGWMRHTGEDPYTFFNPGFNVRPTEIAAAIGLVQLARIDKLNDARARNHQTFTELLEGCPRLRFPTVPPDVTPSWFGLVLFIDGFRDELAQFLGSNGVESRPILGGNLARQPAFQNRNLTTGPLPGADKLHDTGLYLGLHPTLDSPVADVAALIREFLE